MKAGFTRADNPDRRDHDKRLGQDYQRGFSAVSHGSPGTQDVAVPGITYGRIRHGNET